MKKIHFLIFINSLFINLQAQNFDWTKREGQSEYDYGYGIANDTAGNIYVSGKYEKNANFSGTILPLQGNHDIYVAKYSSTGSLTWIRTAGGVNGDYAHSLACDGTNYVYIAGEIEGTGTNIKFIGSSINLNCQGINDAFFAKYDLNGNLIWANRAGGVYDDKALAITYDYAGNIYICGYFSGTATFGTTTINGFGIEDVFVAKYDMNGVFQWVRSAGSAGRDEAKAIKCDAAGNIYVCGMYSNGAVFGSQTLIAPNGYFEAFLAKYLPDGTLAWVKSAGGDYDDLAWALTIDNSNKIYITGEFNAYALFNGTPLITTGSNNIFVASYDDAGNLQWVKGAGGPGIDRARGIGSDGTHIYITGQFDSTATFGPYSVSGVDHNEIFIAKITNAGNFQWVMPVGGPVDSIEDLGYESGIGICAEASGNVYATGGLLNGGVFGNNSFLPYSRVDVFVSKILQNIDPPKALPLPNLTVMVSKPATFTVSATGGPPLSYQWQKNGINISGATSSSFTITNTQFTHAGQYRVIVTNIYGVDTSGAGTLTVIPFNADPTATITTPETGTFYHAGDVINFSGSATDTEDGSLPASAFEWTVDFYTNDTSFTPGPIISSGISSGSFAVPNTGETSPTVFYRLNLKVTDSNGLTDTAFVDILPLTSTISINTQPPGLRVTFNGQPKATPFSILTVEGLLINIGVVSPQNKVDLTYAFSNWQHGGNASQTIMTGAGDSSYTAVYNSIGTACVASGIIDRDFWANVAGTNISDIPVNTAPTSTSHLTIFEGPSQVADNYASRIKGYICPPVTGNYIFWIASDNNSELWLSTDDQVVNKVKIASVSGYTSSRAWIKYPSQQSFPISLIAGAKYYIEAIHKEGTQGDNLAVGWQLPDSTFERPIPGTRLSPFTIPLTSSITSPLDNSFFNEGSAIPIQATVTGEPGTIQKVEFFAGTSKLGEDLTSPYSFIWNNVSQGSYELTCKVIASGNTSAVSAKVNVFVNPIGGTCNATGVILREIWNNISGTTISTIPINTAPSLTEQLSVFQSPANLADNYGQRIRGYVCAPVSGNYIFWIASDDNSELWLSTNDNPANKQKIASVSGYTSSGQWTKYTTQQSIAINLTAGVKYYIEAIHKEGTQGDNLAVGWQLPNGAFERPIPGTRLSPFTIPLTATIASPINNSFFNEGSTITIETSVTGEPGTIQKVEFFADSTKLGEDLTSPYSFIWNNISQGAYELSCKVIASGNTSAVSAKVNVFVNPIGGTCNATGVILREIWNNISGTTVSSIPISTAPSLTEQISIFQSPTSMADNYGQRIRGYVCPPVTGNYIFWIASDDNSELWLSINDNPANKQKIASVSGYTSSGQWTKYTTQQSIAINLTAGVNYYIEALHKEGSQGDNLAVGWQLPNGALERPIPGTRLSPFSVPLTATIISPANNTSFSVGSAIAIQATTSGGTGAIQKVEFFAGATSLGEDLTSPYNITWNNAAIGSYALTAKVTDNGNNSSVSTIINISVNAPDQLTTAITSPLNNTSFNAGSPISIQASASGGTGTIQKVEFFAGTTNLGESITSPYSLTWNNAALGNYALTSKVTDSGNNTSVSAIINIAIINLPVVSITSPANNTSYPSPANITVNASATSNGGSIAKVEFYQGSTKIGEDLSAPYSFTWTNVTAGNYALKAIATDNIGQAGTSQEVNIVVTTCSTPVITPSGPTTMCSGSVTLQANSGSGYMYQWKKDGVNITGATNSFLLVTLSGTYQVKIIQGSCISWSAPTTVKIQSGLSAAITPGGPTTFCTGGSVKLYANTCSGYTYIWKKDGINIPGAASETYIATTAGKYQLQVTQAGVNAWSSLVTVTVNDCRGLETIQNQESSEDQLSDEVKIFQMKVYPNPNTGLFTIELNMPLIKEEKVKMRILNILGQEVYQKEYEIKDKYIREIVELDKSLPTGIYTLQVIIGNKVENTSVVMLR